MFCGNCGNEISDNAKFCPKCGQMTDAGDAMAQNATQPQYVSQSYVANADVAQDNEVLKKKKWKKGVTIGCAAAAVVLVVAVAVVTVAILVLRKGRDYDTSTVRRSLSENVEYEEENSDIFSNIADGEIDDDSVLAGALQSTENQEETAGLIIEDSELEIIASLTTEANCEEWGKCGDDLYWYYADGMLVIRGTGDMWGELYYDDFTWEKLEYDDDDKLYYAPFWSREIQKETVSLVIEEGCTSISACIFWNNGNLSRVVLPDSLRIIGYGAFGSCYSLTSITIPDGITEIGDHVFRGCTGLTNIVLPNSVTRIGNYAFRSCKSMESITIPSSVTEIGTAAFMWCDGLEYVAIPDGVVEIGRAVFQACTNLKTVTIPDSVTRIEYYAFGECTALTNIVLPDSVMEIGSAVFYECTSLTSIIIPNGVMEVDFETFYGCVNLTSVTIGSSVTKISGYAFENCDNLTQIIWENNEYSNVEEFKSAFIRDGNTIG